MKASVLTNYGLPDNFKLQNVEQPVPKDHEVLVEIFAASINSWDWEILMGKPFVNRIMVGLLKPKKIKILGCDIAGRIKAIGKSVKQFEPGDEIFGDLSGCGWGGFAEYVCAPENVLTFKPSNLSFKQAAAVPQAGLLALQGLRDKGQIQSGQKVLINGAGGGVGCFAIQLAHFFGAEVTDVDRADKTNMMRLLGADHVIDYEQKDFTQNGKTYDLILDVADHRSIFDCKRALNPGGTYVIVGGSSARIIQALFLGPFISMIEGKKMGLLLHKANKGLDDLRGLLEAEKIVPVIDKQYSLAEIPAAMRYFGKGNSKGKLIILEKSVGRAKDA